MDNAIAEKLVAAINRLADCMASASEAAPDAINYPEAAPAPEATPAPAPAPAPIEEKKKPGRPKKEEAAPAPAAPAAPAITLDSLIVRLKAFVALDEAANGQKVKALNQSFGVAKLTALDSSKYAEWSDKLKELEAGSPDEDSLV